MIVDKKRCLIPSATKGKISTPVMCMHVLVYQMIWFVFIMQVIMVCVCVCLPIHVLFSYFTFDAIGTCTTSHHLVLLLSFFVN